VSVREALRAPAAPVRLADLDPRATPLVADRASAEAEFAARAEELYPLQEKLFAERTRSVLLVLQGMDGSGKGGAIRHVAGQLNPNSLAVRSFKTPTEEELAHHFLWRIHPHVPGPGRIAMFDRSHYEDVLIVRVHGMVGPDELETRYEDIAAFEADLASQGTAIVKAFLHISREEQCERMVARLDQPKKHWKFNPGDLDERERWDEYVDAYETALGRCNPDSAPWYVIPSDRKWYRNWALQSLLLETLLDLDPRYPVRDDLEIPALRARLDC